MIQNSFLELKYKGHRFTINAFRNYHNKALYQIYAHKISGVDWQGITIRLQEEGFEESFEREAENARCYNCYARYRSDSCDVCQVIRQGMVKLKEAFIVEMI